MQAQRGLRVVVCIPRWPDFDPTYAGWVRQAFRARNEALATLRANGREDRVVAFHPAGFPGRHAALRTTVVIVDDVWALVGTSHLRRRGMTFDEGVDVSSMDRRLDGDGASTAIRTFRQALMASLAGVNAPPPGTTDPLFSRLAGTRSCYDVIVDLVGEGGLGHLSPFWPGPPDDALSDAAQSDDVADPDGVLAPEDLVKKFAAFIAESATSP